MEPNHDLRLSYDFPDSVLTRVCIAEGPQRMPFCLTFGRRWECGLLQAESLAHARTYSRGDMSESRIDDLNPEQLRAATAGEEGAGTGKTKTLAARVASRLRAGLRTRCCAGAGEPWVRPKAARREPSGAAQHSLPFVSNVPEIRRCSYVYRDISRRLTGRAHIRQIQGVRNCGKSGK
jgi:hypothetical protein